MTPTWEIQIFVDEKQVIKFAWPYISVRWSTYDRDQDPIKGLLHSE